MAFEFTFDPWLYVLTAAVTITLLAVTWRCVVWSSKSELDPQYEWARPTSEAVSCILEHFQKEPADRQIIVDAGGGAKSWITQIERSGHPAVQRGLRVTTLDRTSDSNSKGLSSKQSAGLLLLIWPSSWAEQAVATTQAFCGNLLAYVGDPVEPAWQLFMSLMEGEWVQLQRVMLPPCGSGRSDVLLLFRRRSSHLDHIQAAGQRQAASSIGGSQPDLLAFLRRAGLDGQPPACQTSEMLLPFFQGKGTDSRGRWLKQLREFDFEMMELTHDYIQWMFPTDEQSRFNFSAPLLTPKLQRLFGQDEQLKEELRQNLSCFCNFLGLDVRRDGSGRPCIVVAAHFHERVPDCWTATFGGNHNWLRISRALRCLGLCGLRDEQQALMDCLESVQERGLARCGQSIMHWRVQARAVPSVDES